MKKNSKKIGKDYSKLDQFNCVDDVSDDDIIECYPFFSFVEIYIYDSRKNREDRYKLIY